MTHNQVPFDEFLRRAARPIPVKDTPETRAAIQRAREELMTPGGPELIADLLDGIGGHVALLESERGGLLNEQEVIYLRWHLVRRITNRYNIPFLLNAINAGRICEVGVRNGEHLLSLLTSVASEVVAVDLWQETGRRSENDDCYTQAELDEQYAHVAALDTRVIVDRNQSIVAATHYPDGYFDFVYIDADHTEPAVEGDLRAWWPKVRAGGILSGHDYLEVSPICKDGTQIHFGVISAVNRFVAKLGLGLHVDCDSDWFIVKCP